MVLIIVVTISYQSFSHLLIFFLKKYVGLQLQADTIGNVSGGNSRARRERLQPYAQTLHHTISPNKRANFLIYVEKLAISESFENLFEQYYLFPPCHPDIVHSHSTKTLRHLTKLAI